MIFFVIDLYVTQVKNAVMEVTQSKRIYGRMLKSQDVGLWSLGSDVTKMDMFILPVRRY